MPRSRLTRSGHWRLENSAKRLRRQIGPAACRRIIGNGLYLGPYNDCTLTNGRAPHYVSCMAEIVESVHFIDKQMLDRLSMAILLVLVGSGLAACMVGALTYDFGRLLSAW